MPTMRGRIGLQAMGSENKLRPSKGECSRLSAAEGLPCSELSVVPFRALKAVLIPQGVETITFHTGSFCETFQGIEREMWFSFSLRPSQ